jgi:hypothetical protein
MKGFHSAPVAQLDRASGYEPEGREFESPRAHHLFLLSHSLTDDRFLLNFGRGRNVMKT